jgi:hypothetical protein
LKGKILTLPLTILMLISILVVGFVATVVASDTGELAFYASPVQSSLGYGASNEVFWRSDNLPGGYPFFDLKVNITEVSNLRGMVFSVHWDPTVLNCTSFTPGTFLPAGLPEATGWFSAWDYAAGNVSEMANVFVTSYGPTSVSKPSWGWVMTLHFKYLGSTPSPGSPVDTDILIVDEPYPPNHMDTLWENNTYVLFDFDYLSDPYVHTCHFHFETPPSVGGKATLIAISTSNLEPLALYVALVSTIMLAVSVSVAYIKCRKKQ